MSNSVRPHRWQPTRLPCPWDSPGKNTGVGCHFLLQYMKVKSESEVTQSCPTLCDPMDCSLPASPVHGIFQARVLEWGAIAFSDTWNNTLFFFFFLFFKEVSKDMCWACWRGEVAYRMGEKGSWEGIGDKVEQKNKIKQETGLIQTISELCMTNAFLNFMSKKKHKTQWCLPYG